MTEMSQSRRRKFAIPLVAMLSLGAGSCGEEIVGVQGSWVVIQTFTSGSRTAIDADGYSVSVDGGAAQAVGASDYATFGSTPGSHTAVITGIASNCSIATPLGPGDFATPATVDVGADAVKVVNFRLECI